eukprot:scaffold121_cov356-Pavlova_lutheri.AAC.20
MLLHRTKQRADGKEEDEHARPRSDARDREHPFLFGVPETSARIEWEAPSFVNASRPAKKAPRPIVRNVAFDSRCGQEVPIDLPDVSVLGSGFLCHLHEVTDRLLRRALHHAMPDVQDVWSGLGAMEAIVHRFLDPLLGCEEEHGVDVPLDDPPLAERLPSFGDVGIPIQPDHIGRAISQGAQFPDPSVGVEDHRHPGSFLVDASNDPLHVRQAQHLELFGREVVGPGIEDLHHLCTAVDLIDAVLGQHVRQPVQQQVDRLGLVGHGRFGVQEMSIRLSFPRVRCQCPWRTHESHQCGLLVDLAPQRLQDGPHERKLRVRIAHLHHDPFHVFQGTKRSLDARSFPFHHVELHAHRGKRREDVAEEDHRVGPEGTPWLQGELHGDLRRLGTRAKRILVRVGAELRHVPSGLAHQPHRRAFHRLATGRAHQERVLVGGGGHVHAPLDAFGRRERPLGGREARRKHRHGRHPRRCDTFLSIHPRHPSLSRLLSKGNAKGKALPFPPEVGMDPRRIEERFDGSLVDRSWFCART